MSHDSTSRTRAARWRAQTRGPSAAARIRRLLGASVPTCLLAACVLGIAIRVFFQDRMGGFTAYYFYATPPIVLAGLGLAAGAWWLVARRWKPAVPPLVLGIVCLIWAYQVTWYHNPSARPSARTQRILFWNVARGAYGWSRVARELRARDADIVGLVEAGEDVAKMEAFWREHLPQYQRAVHHTGVTLLAKGDIRQRGSGYIDWAWYLHAEVGVGDEALDVVVVDVFSATLRSRRLPLDALCRVLEPLEGRPVLLIGDFNTPTDSVHLRPLRCRYANAFELAGSGYAATWPLPLPVLTIDQAWFSGPLQIGRCDFGWTWASDHRPIELEVTVAP